MKKNKITPLPRKKTPISQLDGLTVNGIPFLSVRLYRALAQRCKNLRRQLSYQENRTLKHECSLKRQGLALSKLHHGIKQFQKHLAVIDGVMDTQDNAILFWNRRYDAMKLKFQTALVFAVAAILGLSLTISYLMHLEQGWSMPWFDRLDAIIVPQLHPSQASMDADVCTPFMDDDTVD